MIGFVIFFDGKIIFKEIVIGNDLEEVGKCCVVFMVDKGVKELIDCVKWEFDEDGKWFFVERKNSVCYME